MRYTRLLSLLLLGGCLLPNLVYAQEFRATMTGRVVDSANLPVPGVAIQVKNIATNEVAHALTDDQGNYTVPFLKPGTYSLTAEMSGFKKFTREGLVLNVGQAATVNITLEIGEVTEQVTVLAETPLLETAKADRGGVIDNQRVEDFPLNARNPFMLSMLIAGVNYNGNIIYQRPFDNGAIAEWTINGSQTRGNEFLLDGAPNNSQAGGNNIALVPPVDSVQEFKIQTNSYDSQYGKTSGGIINVSLKSGTNDFHGAVYEFARRNNWDANSFQNNARNAPRSGHFLDQYGVQVGGPVYLPKLYNGRDKTFFMFNYEGYREGQPRPLTQSVPAPEMRNGDFSRLVDAQGRRITIFDPATGRNVNGTWVRDPFPNNIIPPNRINPLAQRILSFMPMPNTRTAGAGYSQQNYFVPGGASVAKDDFWNWVLKVDQNFGDRHRMFFRYAANDRTEFRMFNGLRGPAEDAQDPLKRINKAGVVDWVGTLDPTLIFNLRVSANRYIEFSTGKANQGFDMTTLGFPASLVRQIPGGPWFGRYEFDQYMTLGRYFGQNITNTFAIHPSVSKIRGAHSIKGGLDMRWIQYSTQNIGNPFFLRANRNFTQREFNRGDALSGNAIATFLLGTPSEGRSENNLFPIFLFKYYAPWVQDDWKVTPRLTLNLGLRWDFNIAPNERYNRLNRSLDASAVNPADSLIDRTRFPGFPQLHGGLLFAGTGGVPRIAANIRKFNIQPRFGAAYQVNNKLVVRGGWGRYFLNPSNDYLQSNGYSLSTPLIATLDGGRTTVPNVLNNLYPGGLQVPPGNSLGLLTFLGRDNFRFVNPNFRIPHVNQFSLGFQYELPWQSKVELSYVGSRTKNLQTERAFNEPGLAMRQRCNPLEGGDPRFCNARVPNPFQGLAPFRGTDYFDSSTLSRWDLARPFPQFGRITEGTLNEGAIWYNSLQVTFETRSKGGLNLISTYTLSKQVERWGYADVQRGIWQQGLYFADRPHRFTVGSVYPLPLGQGRRWFNTSHWLWGRLISGWENTVIFYWQSGRPWDLNENLIYVKDARIKNIDWSKPKVQAVRPCVGRMNDDGSITMQPFSVQAGCTDFNFIIKPQFAPARLVPFRDGRIRLHTVPQADVSFIKNTRITETTSLQFRAEAFNITNTYMFHRANFVNNPNDANFGSIIKASVSDSDTNFPRQIQLAVKFIW